MKSSLNATLTLRRPARPMRPVETVAPATCTQDQVSPINSESLLKGATHMQIVHNGSIYQLRATRLGKLILTK
jgi:hemin uptake protein HemP